MAESEDEIDVEDISDGEQISNLRNVVEDDQKESWYDKDIGNHSFLNSSRSPFSSDYCDTNSWLFDTNTVWSLDPSTDDKSRALIEKMILEEQMYVYRSAPKKSHEPLSVSSEINKRKQHPVRRSPSTKIKGSIRKAGKELSVTHRKPWTVEEQQLFEQGLGLYGRSWTKIAKMIHTRTTLQVKNYAKQYFKQKNKSPVTFEINETQGIQEQCNEMFVVANVEEVVSDNCVTEEDQSCQSSDVFLVSNVNSDGAESDEDIEVNIDGSDSEGDDNTLIPGQTTSCPEAVYSALVQAAAKEEISQDPVIEEKNHFISSEEKNSCATHSRSQEDSNKALSLSSECTETTRSGDSESGSKKNVVMDDTGELRLLVSNESGVEGNCDEMFTPEVCYNCNVHESEVNLADNKNCEHLPSTIHALDKSCCVTLEECHATPFERACEDVVKENNLLCGVVDSNVSRDSSNSIPENDWEPVTCGEVTSSELIPTFDREQPENSDALHKKIVIDRNIVQDVEKEHNAEFFMGRALKTPERYMKIRNYILEMWEKNKPCYLFKTAVRGGLRNCGDVNSIGRVHAFLEDIGVINEGCLDRPVPPVPRVRQQGEVTDAKENVQMESWVNSLRPRKKRPRNRDGDWIDFSKPEGMTIQHLSPDEQAFQEGAPNDSSSPIPPRKKSPHSKSSYDPFLLVPCRKFPSPSAVPFDVLIQSETLVVIDTHAHISTTEVIGLLGGNYSYGSRRLKVSKAIPCRSLSTGLQCEMDPVSQTQASEDLAHQGLAVVGWYHSHPTFASIPSVRDIETQAKFQEWFGKGGAPFVGIIVSPYNYSNPSSQSQIRCLTVSDEWESAGQYRLPYQFDYEVYEVEADEDETVEQVKGIADDYRTYPFRVQLNRRFGSSSDFNLLDKLLESLRARVTSNSCNNREAFVNRIRDAIAENIKPQPTIQQCETIVESFLQD